MTSSMAVELRALWKAFLAEKPEYSAQPPHILKPVFLKFYHDRLFDIARSTS